MTAGPFTAAADARALLAVDTAEVSRLANQLIDRAEVLDGAAHAVATVAGEAQSAWQGRSAAAFTDQLRPVPEAMSGWATRMRSAARILSVFANRVGDLQAEARRAQSGWDSATAAVPLILTALCPADPFSAAAAAQLPGIASNSAYEAAHAQWTASSMRMAQAVADYAQLLASTRAAVLDLCDEALGLRAGTGVLDAVTLAAAEDLASATNLTPAQAAALFADLTPAQIQVLVHDDPDAIGNLDGVPLTIRAEANQIRWTRDVDALEAGPQTLANAKQLALLLSLMKTPGAQLVLFDPAADHYGVMFGDADTAAHVAVFVPGVGDDSNVGSWVNTYTANIYRGSLDTAVIMWKGYDDPDIANAAFLGRADAGAASLHNFIDGMTLSGGQSLTLVGHSYGSVVIGTALARDGVHPTNVVVEGSPGMTVQVLAQLHLAKNQLYVEQAPNDYVPGWFGGVGDVPSDPLFGATRLKTNGPNLPQVSGHSMYFTAGSQALDGIKDVVSGNVPSSDVQSPSVADRVGAFIGAGQYDPARDLADLATQHYHGPGAGALQLGDHLYDGVEHDTGHVVGAGVNAIEHPVQATKNTIHTIEGWL